MKMSESLTNLRRLPGYRSRSPGRGRPGERVHQLGAGGAVDRERRRVSDAAGPGALEAVRDVAARRDGAVVAGVGEGGVLPGLGEAAVEVAGDLLVAGEGEGQRPPVDGGRAGVLDDHLGGEAAGPGTVEGVGDVASAAAGPGADGPGEGSGSLRSGAV